MPRTYQKKTISKYSDATLELALLDVEKGKSIFSAAKEHRIPYETLRRWVIKRPSKKGPGRTTYLSFDEEHCIVEGLKFLAQCGFPFDRKDVVNLVETYFKNSKVKNPFPNGCPGIEFLRAFEKRWSKELGKRKPELLTAARAKDFSLITVDNFFEIYVKLLNDNKLEKSPERIFNLDEIGLGTDPRSSKVFIGKSSRIAYLKSPDAGKAMYSVLFCISATGVYMPPFVIYKGLHLYQTWTMGGPKGTLYGCTESGWMMDTVFESWINHFIKYVKEIEKPVLVIFDGHGSHLTYYTVRQAMDNGIILLCLPPNTSHALQPLDVGVFAPMKKTWKNVLKTWYRESRQQNVSKASFPFLLSRLFSFLKPVNAMKGFEGCGLYPVNKEKVKHRILLTEKGSSCNMVGAANTSLEQDSPSTLSLQDVPSSSLWKDVPSTSSCQDVPSTSKLEHTGVSQTQCNSVISMGDVNPASQNIHNYSSPTQKEEAHSNDKFLSLVSSPFKDLKVAILSTLSPTQSSVTKLALQNSKRNRKRVQSKTGEVLTEEMVAERLLLEEQERQKKKRKLSQKSTIRVASNKKYLKKINMQPEVRATDVKPGAWVSVEYVGKKSTFQFIGQIIDTVEDQYEVKYLTRSGQKYSFPDSDDLDLVNINSIVKILPEPTLDNRGHYAFSNL